MKHLSDALDKVRKAEYARLQGTDRSYIKGQKYVLLSNHENLTLDGRRSLKTLLAANKRLNTVSAERVVWSVVGLQKRSVGTTLLQ
ncbi:MAG: transposase [Candidatus Nitrotoga sp.]